ncbi:hypothetical protein FVF58_39585 [Paraburkholderia panacisoli]|uniref:K+ potassium transporter integral membrane domain-containing protein n=1 Tax=Paraburkholderia panacisoli TaxID=2603818 RepID=A0A5B0GGJ6_9BURK|nr:KUP/HAK/KT family potassium transporter [Paraburkholderia panacisoli]KAA1000999.1 hypothetical protein FVF58_39585 [Paraburkholderia panacisoli]
MLALHRTREQLVKFRSMQINSSQVYVPFINVSLYAAAVFLVVLSRSSDNLAAAYGIAVASTMLLTTLLMYFISHCLWNWKPLATLAVRAVGSGRRDVRFEHLEGGWFPLLAGGTLFTVMTTWDRGRETVVERMKSDNLPLAPLIHSLCDGAHSPPRVNGTAVFPVGVVDMAPTAFLHP